MSIVEVHNAVLSKPRFITERIQIYVQSPLRSKLSLVAHDMVIKVVHIRIFQTVLRPTFSCNGELTGTPRILFHCSQDSFLPIL